MKTRLQTSTHKKVIVHKANQDLIKGYVHPQSCFAAEGLELLNEAGQLLRVAWAELKQVDFVRELDAEASEPERKVFGSRPKLEGLWVRLRFKDNDVLEGIIANNLIEGTDKGFMLTPPDLNANHQRIFVPRQALAEITVLGVITPGQRRRRVLSEEERARQARLFAE